MGLTDRKTTDASVSFKERLEAHKAKAMKERKSRLVLGIWGHPKTGKTGISLDFPDRNIYVMDWDRGVESTWIEHHDASEKITVYCPIEVNKDNIVDINASEQNSHDFIKYVREKIDEGEDPIFVFDGVDSWFDSCILKVNPNPTVVTKIMPFQYGARNKTFEHLMMSVYHLPCDVIFITHEEDYYIDNSPAGVRPKWRDWGGKLEQEIHCYRKKFKNELQYVAELVGSRTNGNLVGTKFIIREGEPPNIKWNGIPELRERKI